MKSNADLIDRMSRMSRNGNDVTLSASVASSVLDDLLELHRLESEPKCEWLPIADEQRNGQSWIVASARGPIMMAAYVPGLGWTADNTFPLGIQPTHLLAGIPKLVALTPPTADEWRSAAVHLIAAANFIAARQTGNPDLITPAIDRIAQLVKRNDAA